MMSKNKYFMNFLNKKYIVPLKFNEKDKNLFKINNKYKK